MTTILKIRNWDKFQHYKDRRPPWIKLHFALLASKDWVMLDDASRVLAVASMLVASQSDLDPGCFEADPDYIKRVAYLNSEPDFKPLIDNGFLEVVEGDASDCKRMLAEFRPETETETETETEKADKPPKNLTVNDCPENISPQIWTDFIGVRRAKRAPLTPTAWARIENQLKAGVAKGYCPDDMLGEAVERGWQAFKLEWYENSKGKKPEPETRTPAMRRLN